MMSSGGSPAGFTNGMDPTKVAFLMQLLQQSQGQQGAPSALPPGATPAPGATMPLGGVPQVNPGAMPMSGIPGGAPAAGQPNAAGALQGLPPQMLQQIMARIRAMSAQQ